MPAGITVNTVTITITGIPVTCKLLSYKNQPGAEPARAVILLPAVYSGEVTSANMQEKTVTISVDGVLLITGTIERITKRFSDRSLIIEILDARHRMNFNYVGHEHLGTANMPGNSLPVLGADITFNAEGKPNMAATVADDGTQQTKLNAAGDPQFVYELPDYGVTTDDCIYTDSGYWSYREIVWWLFKKYVTNVTFPGVIKNAAVFTTGGMNQKAREIFLLGVPVADAIDMVMSNTSTLWYLDGSNTVRFFSRTTPTRAETYNITPENINQLPQDYTLNTLEECIVTRSTEDVVTDMDIIGANQVKEIASTASDYYTAVDTFEIHPQVPWIIPVGIGGAAIASMTWRNWVRDPGGTLDQIRYGFDHAKYEAHAAGKNIRRKDPAKIALDYLSIYRNRSGQYVGPRTVFPFTSECALYKVGTEEMLGTQYWAGATYDPNRGEIVVPQIYYNGGKKTFPAPTYFTLPLVLEIRPYVTATNNPNGLTVRRRAVFRNEFIHVTREAVKIIMPVTVNLTFNSAGMNTWTVTEKVPVPANATRDYALSGSSSTVAATGTLVSAGLDVTGTGTLFLTELNENDSIIVGGLTYIVATITSDTALTLQTQPQPAFSGQTFTRRNNAGPGRLFTATLNAGIAEDGISPLNEIKSFVVDEIGRPVVTMQGAFPTYKTVTLGTQVTLGVAVGNVPDMGQTGNEIVVAVAFDGSIQRTEFLASNYTGASAAALAKAFVDQRRYRIG